MDDPRRHESTGAMSDAVADAWAEVFIDVYERLEAERSMPANAEDTAEPPRAGLRVAVDQGSVGDNPTSGDDKGALP
jgi:hypothetical protein